MTREDVRLADRPLQAHSCLTCGGTVLVGKSSWDQTTIQWDAISAAACLERRATGRLPLGGCFALRDSIREAAVTGALEVAGEATPTHR